VLRPPPDFQVGAPEQTRGRRAPVELRRALQLAERAARASIPGVARCARARLAERVGGAARSTGVDSGAGRRPPAGGAEHGEGEQPGTRRASGSVSAHRNPDAAEGGTGW